MDDYSSIGLNNNLQPINAPITQNRAINPMDYDGQLERNSILTSKVRTLNFSKGFGGTLELGGNGNGNGVLEVQGSAGNEVVTLDNTGLTVYNGGGTAIVTAGTSGITINEGNLTLKNSIGTTIIDSTGLVSSANFSYGTAGGTTVGSTTGTAYSDMPNMSLNVVVGRTVTALVSTTFSGYADESYLGDSMAARITLDGTQIGATMYAAGVWDETASVVAPDTITGQTFTSLTAGTHTIKVQWRVIGSGQVRVINSERILSYLILGS